MAVAMSGGDPTTAQLFDSTPYIEGWTLGERFGIPPFSTLDTRGGVWRRRRARWQELDMSSRDGRRSNLTFVPARDDDGRPARDEVSQKISAVGTTSEFDPLLAECALRWWSPEGGVVLDPFAGGSVRGIVSGVLGREYHGIDLSPTQIEANEVCRTRLADYLAVEPEWYVGDSSRWQPDVQADFILSCPPYGSLEKYSDDPADLSAQRYEEFLANYGIAVRMACDRLRNNRFAVFVVGNYREGDKLRPFVARTIDAFEEAGLTYHADLSLLNSTATAGMRASAWFNVLRKPTFCHQHVAVFVKGDLRAAATAAERVDPLDPLEIAEQLESEVGVDVTDGRR